MSKSDKSSSNLQKRQELADFLRTRREKIRPEEAGFCKTGRRRTPGLRREEVAELAGVGTAWYTWLEQAREIQPSAEVLSRLARALKLSPFEAQHLFSLSGRAYPGSDDHHVEEKLSPSLKRTLHGGAVLATCDGASEG
jgi:transcriptional regulator with XRE-family HTH domain